MPRRTIIESSPLRDEEGPIPTVSSALLDPSTGRILPLTEKEREARRVTAARALRAIRQITDESDTDERWREIYKAIDEHTKYAIYKPQ